MNTYIKIKAGQTGVEKVPYEGQSCDLFAHLRQEIGAGCAEPVYLGRHPNGMGIVMLVDEDGYYKYMGDTTKINLIGTAIYNRPDNPRPHYILGDLVICGETYDEENGGNFVALSEAVATSVMAFLADGGFIRRATEMEIPDQITEPKCSIKVFDTADELMEAVKGNGNGGN